MNWNYAISQKPIAYSNYISLIEDEVLFNWNSLSDCWNLFAWKANYDDINQIKLETYDTPQQDWGWILSYFINWKAIDFTLVMKYDSETELNTAIDDLKRKLAIPEWILEITVNWERRRALVSLTSLSFNRNRSQKTVQENVQISFKAMNFFYSKQADNRVFQITWNYSVDISYNWTAKSFFKTYMVFNVWNSWVNQVKITKDWYSIGVNQPINDWDVLIIDWVNKIITLNWNQIDYTGIFRRLEYWNNPFQITFNSWAVVNITTTIIYNKNRL